MRSRVLAWCCSFAVCGGTLVCGTAQATDGYFSHGYGMKAAGRGGTAMALTDDVFGGANNPATMAFAGNRFEMGITAFSPRRNAERSGLGPGVDGATDSNRNYFEIPEFGYNHMLRDNLSFGVTVYGNGGLDTAYPGGRFDCGRGPANMLCGSGELGVDLEQMVIAPTLAWAFTPTQSIGIAPLIVYQRFEAYGLQAFAETPGLSVAPGAVTNNGHDNSFGAGVRIGYYARLNDHFAVGVSFAPRIRMSPFASYKGLFADRGRFDIPENYAAGLAWTPTAALTLSLDYQRINYSGVTAVGNPSLMPAQLGSAFGPGFGWRDANVEKMGVEYRSSPRWTWRAGFNHTNNPVPSSDVTFNILAPGIETDHATFGFTYGLSSRDELTVAYMHAFGRSVQGASILPAFMGGMPSGVERIAMHEDSLGVAYSQEL